MRNKQQKLAQEKLLHKPRPFVLSVSRNLKQHQNILQTLNWGRSHGKVMLGGQLYSVGDAVMCKLHNRFHLCFSIGAIDPGGKCLILREKSSCMI